MQIDLRIPVTIDRDALLEKLSQNVAKYDLQYKHFDYVAPLYVPKDTELVKTLMTVYQDQTGDVASQPQVSGGATFARTMHNCVAFGAMLQLRLTLCTRLMNNGRFKTCLRQWISLRGSQAVMCGLMIE